MAFGWKFLLQIQMTFSKSALILKFFMFLEPTYFDKIHINKPHLGKKDPPFLFPSLPSRPKELTNGFADKGTPEELIKFFQVISKAGNNHYNNKLNWDANVKKRNN